MHCLQRVYIYRHHLERQLLSHKGVTAHHILQWRKHIHARIKRLQHKIALYLYAAIVDVDGVTLSLASNLNLTRESIAIFVHKIALHFFVLRDFDVQRRVTSHHQSSRIKSSLHNHVASRCTKHACHSYNRK